MGTLTTTESEFTAGTFTNGFEIIGGDTYHCQLMSYGPLLAEYPATMNAFTASSAYDPAVNRILPFVAVSSDEPAVEGFSPLAARPMSKARRNWQR